MLGRHGRRFTVKDSFRGMPAFPAVRESTSRTSTAPPENAQNHYQTSCNNITALINGSCLYSFRVGEISFIKRKPSDEPSVTTQPKIVHGNGLLNDFWYFPRAYLPHAYCRGAILGLIFAHFRKELPYSSRNFDDVLLARLTPL